MAEEIYYLLTSTTRHGWECQAGCCLCSRGEIPIDILTVDHWGRLAPRDILDHTCVQLKCKKIKLTVTPCCRMRRYAVCKSVKTVGWG